MRGPEQPGICGWMRRILELVGATSSDTRLEARFQKRATQKRTPVRGFWTPPFQPRTNSSSASSALLTAPVRRGLEQAV